MDGKQVRLGQGVVNVKDFGEEVDGLGGMLKGKATLLLQASGSIDTDRELLAVVAAVREGFDVLKVTNGPGEEVGAHARSGLKGHDLPAVLGGLDLLDRHVAESDLVNGNLDVEIKGSLEVGLVEAGEGSACIRRLELSAEHVVPVFIKGDGGSGSSAGDGLVLGAVETGHVIVDGALELNYDGCLLGDGDFLVKGDGGALGFLIVGEGGGLPALCGFCVIERDFSVEQLELESVEDNLDGWLDDFGIDA